MRVLVCDDHALMAQAMAAHLREHGHEVVVATTPQEGVAEQRRQPFDVCVLDLVFPGTGTDGAEAVGPLLKASSSTKVLVLTAYAGSVLAQQAMAAGAHAMIEKSRPLAVVSATVHRLGMGAARAERDGPRATDPGQPQLTAREREVLALLVQGCSTSEMGERLSISVNTVRKHVHKLLEKFGTSSRLEVVARVARGAPARTPRAGDVQPGDVRVVDVRPADAQQGVR
ncbi:MAG: hypothetical protein JWN08_536 [Frankiales bacterium]|nr:hypothetical protein [Frankiales bacterium]